MDAHPAGSLLSFLAAVPDPRSRHGRRHPLCAILALVCCAIMCGARSYAAIAQWAEDQDIALMHQLGFTRKPPIGGIRKVLITLNLKAFEDALSRWAETLLGRPTPTELSAPEAFALDGKSARGSISTARSILGKIHRATDSINWRLSPSAGDKGQEIKDRHYGVMSKQNPDSLLAVNHCPRCSSRHRSAKACNSSRHAYGAFPISCGGEAWFDFGPTGPMPMPSLSPLAFSPFVCFVVTSGSISARALS